MLRLTAVALMLGALLFPAVAADWPQFHNDARKAGHQGGTEFQVSKDLWWNVKIPKNATIETSPVVSGDVVIVGGSDKVLRAFDTASGKAKWNYTMTDRIVASPAIHNGRVYAVDIKGALVKLDLQTGAKYAQTSVGATLAPPTLDEGKLFIGTEGGTMRAFEVEGFEHVMTPIWNFTVTSFRPDSGSSSCVTPRGEIRSAAAVHDGIVYFGAMNNYVYAINEAQEPDGSVRAQWYNATGDLVLTAPTIDLAHNRVVFASYDGKVRAFNMQKADPTSCANALRIPVWIYTAPDNAQMRSSPATDGTRIYVGTNKGHVVALTADAGQPSWGVSTQDIVVSSPAVSNGIVVVGSDDRRIYWLSASNGSWLRDPFVAQSAIKASPAIDGPRVFVASFDGTLYMFGPEIPKAPDLDVTDVKATADGLSVSIKNLGSAASGATKVRILVGGEFVANVDVPAIQPGASATVTRAYKFETPAKVSAEAIVDPESGIAEQDESNNSLRKDVTPPATSTTSDGGDGGDDGGGLKIPGAGLALVVLALLAAGLVRRRS